MAQTTCRSRIALVVVFVTPQEVVEMVWVLGVAQAILLIQLPPLPVVQSENYC